MNGGETSRLCCNASVLISDSETLVITALLGQNVSYSRQVPSLPIRVVFRTRDSAPDQVLR